MITRRLKEEISYAVQKYYEASGELQPTESFPIMSIHKDEVPEPLSRKIRSIEEQYRDDARASNPSGKPFKEVLLTTSQSERLHIFRGVLENELSRLTARSAMEAAIADCRRYADGTNDGRTSEAILIILQIVFRNLGKLGPTGAPFIGHGLRAEEKVGSTFPRVRAQIWPWQAEGGLVS